MTLLEHLKQRGKSIAAFAGEIGEAENTIRKIAYGQRQPSLPLAVKIS
jgi:transcriptional regulator with XRE-family HTH domain